MPEQLHPSITFQAVERNVAQMDQNGTAPSITRLYSLLGLALNAELDYFTRYGLPVNQGFVSYSDGFLGSVRRDSFQIKVHTTSGEIRLDPPRHSFDDKAIGTATLISLRPGTDEHPGEAVETIYYRPDRTLDPEEVAQLSEVSQLMISMYEKLSPQSTDADWRASAKRLFEARYQGTDRVRGAGGIGLEPESEADFV